MKEQTFVPLAKRKWILSTFAGWFGGAIMIIVTSMIFDGIGLEGFQFYIGISMGGCIGFFQWRTMRISVPIGAAWMWASLAGVGIPFLANDLLAKYGGLSLGSYFLPISVFFGGLLTGIFQYVVLKKEFSGATRWIVACWAGWIAASLTIFAIDYVTDNVKNLAGFFINLALIFSGGPVLGWVTAATIRNILSSPVSEERTEQ